MNKIKDILEGSTILIAGMVNNENNYDKIKLIIQYNFDLLVNVKQIVIILNKSDEISIEEFNNVFKLFKTSFPLKCIVLRDHINRGHQIGYVDLDKSGVFFIKNNIDCEYIIKLSIDIITDDTFLNTALIPSDFYFIPSACINDIYSNYDRMIIDNNKTIDYTDSQPHYQTNMYIIKNKFDDIYESTDEIQRCYDSWISKGYKNVSQNEVLAAEHSLVKFTVKHKINRQSLIIDLNFKNYIDFIKKYNIGDSTLKNIYIKSIGVMHWHSKYSPTIELI
jgi:hypothetical protein